MVQEKEKGNSKIFFWGFGIIFSLIVYYCITSIPFFSYLNQAVWLPLFISLIIILLFFIIGNFSKKVPFYYLSLLFNKKKTNLKKISLKIDQKETEDDIDTLVYKLKKIFNIINSYGYSKESALFLINSIGISKKSAENIISELKKLKNLKRTSIFLGILIAIIVFILINNLNFLLFLKTNIILKITIPFVIFLLFYLEGILITRLPQSFYLKLINFNKKNIIENKKYLLEKYDHINKIKDIEKKDIAIIKQTIKYLLKEGLKKEWIEKVIQNYGFSKNVSDEFISQSVEELKELPKNIKDIKVGTAALKLSLAKIEESFTDLKQIYIKLSELQNIVDDLSKRQKELESISKEKISKQLKNYNIGLKKSKSSKNKNKNIINEDKPLLSINLKDLEKLKGEPEKNEIVDFLYNLVLPHINNYSEKELVSLLLYKGYAYELVEDLILKIKNNKIKFGKQDKKVQEVIINKINLIYNLFSKKNK